MKRRQHRPVSDFYHGPKTPYYHLVPKERGANLAFRKRMIIEGCDDPAVAQELWIMCSRDILFWVNSFCFTYNPRLVPASTVVPFNTYAFQDEVLLEIITAIEDHYDLLIKKSRDQGLTWLVLVAFTWMWQFRDFQSFRLVSRVEDLVDKTEDPDCLMWKVDFILDNQPAFLTPPFNRTNLHLFNQQRKSMMDGASTTGDVGRGGRCGAMLLDEFAAVPQDRTVLSSTRDVTQTRLFVSTSKGTGTAFFGLEKTKIRKLYLHWTLNPTKTHGLYTTEGGKVKILDPGYVATVRIQDKTYQFPSQYPFILDGKVRSPWYDNECARAEHPMEIAQELDMDDMSADSVFFDVNVIREIGARDIQSPWHEGELEFDEYSCDPIEFHERKNGHLKLWCEPESIKSMDCIIGVDISTGTGASNSAISIGNRITGEKVAEYVNPRIKPERLAKLAVALCRYFNEAFIIWDAGGPGRTFGDTIVDDIGYRNIYLRRNDKSITKKVSDVPGVYLNPSEKNAIMGLYRKALKEKTFIQRSYEANFECMQYVYTRRGTVEHACARSSPDPSGAGDSHGDRCIADALLNKGFSVFKTTPKATQKVPVNCLAARRARCEEKLRQSEQW